jgi:hypothetical protein
MQLVNILRALWRLRLVVVLMGVLSLIAGLSVAFKLPSLETRRYEVGVATAKVLVDTPKSQVVEVAPKGSETLGVRANLLANLMVDGALKAEIAKRAGIATDDLEGIVASQADPGSVVAPRDPRGPSLTTRVTASADGDLPFIEIEARAPDAAGASKLAGAAVDGLTAYLDAKAAEEKVAAASRLRVTGLGEPQVGVEVHGPGMPMALALTIFLFLGGCAAILGLFAVIRAWKTVSAEEQLEEYGSRDRLVVVDDDFGEPGTDEDEPSRSTGDVGRVPPERGSRKGRSRRRRAPRDAA